MIAPELTTSQRRAVKVFELDRWMPTLLSCMTTPACSYMIDALKPGFTYLCCEGRASRRSRYLPGKTIDSTWQPKNLAKNALIFPDAMAQEKVYRVTGKPANEADDVPPKGRKRQRSSLRLYMWPGAQTPGAGWLAVVQYGFAEVSLSMRSAFPSRCCCMLRGRARSGK